MRIGILTTDTLHHRYFVQQLCEQLPDECEIAAVLIEKRPYPWRKKAIAHFRKFGLNLLQGVVFNPYLQPQIMARLIDSYEYPRFFRDGNSDWPQNLNIKTCCSVNSPEAIKFLAGCVCDVFFVFGTGLVAPKVFNMPPLGTINAHGGLLPEYRGLDTNLWAAYRGRPNDMTITIHKVEKDFDTGAILASSSLPVVDDLSLVSIRYYTTLSLVRLAVDALNILQEGRALFVEQNRSGEYFGPMPFLKKLVASYKIKSFVKKQINKDS